MRGRAITIRDLAQGSLAGFRSVSLDNPAPAKSQIPVDQGEIRLRIITTDRKSSSAALRALAQEPGTVLLHGRALYPRFYQAGEDEPKTAKKGYAGANGRWLAAFVVVTMLALLGHGGITVIGLNIKLLWDFFAAL